MRPPLKSKSNSRGVVSTSKSYPAPIGGLNTRDPLPAMKPLDAVSLRNIFPRTSYLEFRGGYSNHATGMADNGRTLAVYNKMTGSSEMYCTTATGIYDVSSAGAVGASKLARTSGVHQWTNFGDGTNNWLILVNGADKPAYYNGTNWIAVDGVSSPALTGLTTTNIINVFSSKGRLYFIEKDSLSFWYLAAGAAGGALTEFDLSSFAKKGGYLVAGGNWTVEGGSGPDDRVVFVTSEGECIIYSGTNPGSAADWVLVGVFDIGKPLGRKCLMKYGGDIVILTDRGVFPMLSLISNYEKASQFALSFKIEPTITYAGSTYRGNNGWCMVVYPNESALIVNVPIAVDGEHEQYVMNTITKAWCRFTEWGAEDFAVFNNELYFCIGTKVVKAWTGKTDDGSSITFYGKQAFSNFGDHSRKKFVLFRPVLAVDASVSLMTDIDVDFNDTEMTGTAQFNAFGGALWDDATWDVSYWTHGPEVVKSWTSPDENVGTFASGKIKITTDTVGVQWLSSDYVYQSGGIL